MKFFATLSIIFFIGISILNAQTWSQTGGDINGDQSYSHCGFSVDISADGSIIIVGEDEYDAGGVLNTGRARVFSNASGTWTQIGDALNGDAMYNYAGSSVSISSDGSIVSMGTMGAGIGYVKVFHNNSGTWEQVGNTILGENDDDAFGGAADMNDDGTIIAIGVWGDDTHGSNSGAVKTYQYNSTTSLWEQIGTTILGESANNHFGANISLNADGNIMAITAYNNDNLYTDAGQVKIYEFISGNWSLIGSPIYGDAIYDKFGSSVSLNASGTIVASGAIYNDANGTDAGHVKIYENISGTWTQIGNAILGEGAGDYAGIAVDLNAVGDVVLIGASFDELHGEQTGQARIFRNNSGSWQQVGETIYGSHANDLAGHALTMNSDGTIVAISHQGNGGQRGKVKVFEQIPTSNIETNSDNDISIYPNPTTGVFNLTASAGNDLLSSDEGGQSNVIITNITGKIVKQLSITNQKSIINLQNQPAGIYFIKIRTENNIITKKIIKQ